MQYFFLLTWLCFQILFASCQDKNSNLTDEITKDTVLYSVGCEIKSPYIDSDTIRILFVGNSLTYFNNLPEMVRKHGENNGKPFYIQMLAKPNYALVDHLSDGCLQDLIRYGAFDYLIVQQGPSSQPEGRQLLREAAFALKELCAPYNTQLALFMVWPALSNYEHFDGVIESYTLAAEATKSILCPVGAMWKRHFDKTQDFSYLSADGFHPSRAGSQQAAFIIYHSLMIP